MQFCFKWNQEFGADLPSHKGIHQIASVMRLWQRRHGKYSPPTPSAIRPLTYQTFTLILVSGEGGGLHV